MSAPPAAFPTTRARFAVLGAFALSNAANAFLWISFSPIFAATGAFWAVSPAAVNALSLVFLVLYLPGALLASVVTERFGLRAALVLGAALNLAGAALRAAGGALPSPAGFALALAGQSVAALGQPVFTNSPARLSAEWFARGERDLATTAAALSNAVGNALGSVLPPLAVGAPRDLPAFLLAQAGACAALLAVQALGMRADAPPEAPSAAAAARRRARAEAGAGGAGAGADGAGAGADGAYGKRVSLLAPDGAPPPDARTLVGAARAVARDYGALLASRNFCVLAAGFALGLGLFNALLTLLAQVLAPCGYDADAAGAAGAALLGAGLVAAGAAGAALAATRAYVTALRALIAAGLGATLLFCAALRPGAEGAMLGAAAALGACVIPLLPVALENAAEATFPVPEEVSSGLLIMVGNYVGIAVIYALQGALGTPASGACASVVTPSGGVIVGTIAAAALCLVFFKADYRRAAAEAAGGEDPAGA